MRGAIDALPMPGLGDFAGLGALPSPADLAQRLVNATQALATCQTTPEAVRAIASGIINLIESGGPPDPAYLSVLQGWEDLLAMAAVQPLCAAVNVTAAAAGQRPKAPLPVWVPIVGIFALLLFVASLARR